METLWQTMSSLRRRFDVILMNAAMRHMYYVGPFVMPYIAWKRGWNRTFLVVCIVFLSNAIEFYVWIKCSPLLPLRHASTVPAWGHFSEPPACINKVQIQRRHIHTHIHTYSRTQARTHNLLLSFFGFNFFLYFLFSFLYFRAASTTILGFVHHI